MGESVSMKIMEEVQTRIRSRPFDGIDDGNVIIVLDPRLADREGTELPAILISPTRPEQMTGDGDVGRDGVAYRYIVAIVDHHDGGLVVDTENLDARLLWRETLRLALQHWHTTAIASVWDCRLEPLQPFDRQWLPRNLWVSAFILAVDSIEERIAP